MVEPQILEIQSQGSTHLTKKMSKRFCLIQSTMLSANKNPCLRQLFEWSVGNMLQA